jgi:hypothetical protein
MWRILGFVVALALSAFAGAGGHVYASEKSAQPPEILQERAVLSWHDGKQTIIIEDAISNANASAWIIPVPGKPSRIEQLPDAYFAFLGSHYGMKLIDGSYFCFPGFAIFFALAAGASLVAFNATPWRLAMALIVSFVLSAAVMLILLWGAGGYPHGPVGRYDYSPVVDYETAILAPSNPDAGRAWLRENGLQVSVKQEESLKDYAARGWYLVAARLRATTNEAVRTRPILIQCPSRAAVFPGGMADQRADAHNLDLYVVGKQTGGLEGLSVAFFRKSIYSSEETGLVFRQDDVVTRYLGSLSGTSQSDLNPTWSENDPSQTVYWTAFGKIAALQERVIWAACFAVILIAPWLVRKRSLWPSFWRAAAGGAVVGVLWFAPILLEPQLPTGSGRTLLSAPFYLGIQGRAMVREMMRSPDAEDAKATFDRENVEHHNPIVLEPKHFVVVKYTNGGMKATTLSYSGEPVFLETKWSR